MFLSRWRNTADLDMLGAVSDAELKSLLTALPALERPATLGAFQNTLVPIASRDWLAIGEAARELGEQRGLA